MAALMDKIDWASTEMGTVTDWPDDLRTALAIASALSFLWLYGGVKSML